jgi:50S ribosomal protein L16 3-hydroxylase
MTMMPDAPTPLLGGLDPTRFMTLHWQKRPLFMSGAVPEAAGVVGVETLFDLARHPDAQTRRIARKGVAWSVDHGPLRARQLTGKGSWTVLVQGLNHFLPKSDALLRRFSFIPCTRLDDLMASYATPGGGVGPHHDSYDVFLIQAHGTRRWQISGQPDRELLPDQPIKIMSDFRAEQTFECGPGDLLYLPPGYAHDGVALDDCITLSVGFRAPTQTDLAREVLLWLADRIEFPGLYADHDLEPVSAPTAIDAGLLERVADLLGGIRWQREDVSAFLCQYLSEPKPHILFEPPDLPLSEAAFARAAQHAGVALDLQSLMLHDARGVCCNGEPLLTSSGQLQALRHLADRRFLEGSAVERALTNVLYPLYLAGSLHLAEPAGP